MFEKLQKRLGKNSIIIKGMVLFIHIVIIFFAFIIQTSIFSMIPIFKCSPNLLIIITFSYGLLYGENIGITTGLFCGFLCDIYYNGEFGLYTLIYSLIGYFNGSLNRLFYADSITFPMWLSAGNMFVYNLYIYFTQFFIRKRYDFLYYLWNLILPNILFTVITTVLIYRVIYYLVIVKRNKLSN